jgi:hypothetical protein
MGMDGIRNETEQNGNEKRDTRIRGSMRTEIKTCEWRTAGLLDRSQNRTHRGEGGAEDQSICDRRMGLGKARKEAPSRMKNVSIESSAEKKSLLAEENVYP